MTANIKITKQKPKNFMEVHLKKLQELDNEIASIEKQIRPLQNSVNNLYEFRKIVEKKAEEMVRAEDTNASTIRTLEEAGAEYIYIDLENADTLRSVTEDDGTLDVSFGKVRGCFICNQEISKKEWNILAKAVLKSLEIPFSELKK